MMAIDSSSARGDTSGGVPFSDGASAVNDNVYVSSILDMVGKVDVSAVNTNSSSSPRYIHPSATAVGHPGLLFDGSSYLQFQLGGQALSGDFTVGIVFSATSDASDVDHSQCFISQDEDLTDGLQCWLAVSAPSASVVGASYGFGPASNAGKGPYNYAEGATTRIGETPKITFYPSALMGTEIAGPQLLIFTVETSTLPWTYDDPSGLAAIYSGSGLLGAGVFRGAETTDEACFGGDTFTRVFGRTTVFGHTNNPGGSGIRGVLYDVCIWNQSFNRFQIDALTKYFTTQYKL